MNTPKLFPNIRVTAQDKQRILVNLTGWSALNAAFKAAPPEPEDLKKHILVEHANANREHILRRLVGRLHTTERARIIKALGL